MYYITKEKVDKQHLGQTVKLRNINWNDILLALYYKLGIRSNVTMNNQ